MSILVVPKLLNSAEVNHINDQLPKIKWTPGVDTAYGSAKDVKSNEQSVGRSDAMDSINSLVNMSIRNNKLVEKAVMPTTILYPMLNRHKAGERYGRHVDRPIRRLNDSGKFMRCDVSCTVFLSDPESYKGGRLMIYNGSVVNKIKLQSGDAVFYPTSFIHEVEEVTEGERICAVLWMQSAVEDEYKRDILTDVCKLNNIVSKCSDNPEEHALAAKVHNNLARMWCKF